MKKFLVFIVLFTATLPLNAQASNTLNAGQALNTGDKLISANGKYMLLMQVDGNLCVYKYVNGKQSSFVWCSMEHDFSNATLRMQTDGNLVVYDGAGKAKWSSKTQAYYNPKYGKSDFKPVKLVFLNDGTLGLYTVYNKRVWSNQPSLLDFVWTNRNSTELQFKSNGDMIFDGKEPIKWSWQDEKNLIMKISDGIYTYYYKFYNVKEKSMTMENSTSGPPNYRWINPFIFTTN